MTEANALVAASNMSTYLLGRYGATMCSSDLAEQLHTTSTAIRIGLCRGIDLPIPDKNLPGRGHRWLTVAVAEWLASYAEMSDAPEESRAPAQPNASARRPGRPRKGMEVRHG